MTPSLRRAAIAFTVTIVLNGFLALASEHHAENAIVNVAAAVIGWGVDFPGLLAVAALSIFTGPLFFHADATDSDLLVLATMAIFSGAFWALAVSLVKKRLGQASEPMAPHARGTP